MSMNCTVCEHPDRLKIELLEASGAGPRGLEREFAGLSRSAISRHFSDEHDTTRAPPTETAKLHAERARVHRELEALPDPDRADSAAERRSVTEKRATLGAYQERLDAMLCRRLQSLHDRKPELEERVSRLLFARSMGENGATDAESELATVRRELDELERAVEEHELTERGRKLYEGEVARQAEAERSAEDRRRLEQAREAHTALCRKLEKSWGAFGPLLRAWCQSIESLDLAANRVGEAHSPVNAERFVFVNWLTGKLTSSLDVPTVRMAGIRTPRVNHARASLVEIPEAKATKPESQPQTVKEAS